MVESQIGQIWSRHHYAIGDIIQYDRSPAPFVVDIIPYFKQHGVKTVADAGCGQGRNLLYLLQQGFEGTGIDASRNALELTKKLLEQNGQSAKLIEADLNNIQLDTESIDAIVAVTVLTHFADPTKVLAELHRILRPQGYLLGDFATTRDSTFQRISRGRQIGENTFIEDGTEVKYYDTRQEVERLFKYFNILRLDEIQFEELGHPVSRPYPHAHSSFVVLAQKK